MRNKYNYPIFDIYDKSLRNIVCIFDNHPLEIKYDKYSVTFNNKMDPNNTNENVQQVRKLEFLSDNNQMCLAHPD